jgi:hypothetical protein
MKNILHLFFHDRLFLTFINDIQTYFTRNKVIKNISSGIRWWFIRSTSKER